MLKIAVALLIASSIAAQPASPARYKVLDVSEPDKSVAALNAAADQGYRLLFANHFALLRLDASPPDTYRYRAISEEMVSTMFMDQMSIQGVLGYGWLNNSAFVEKEPHPRNYEYAYLSPFSKTFEREGDSLMAQGFMPVGAPRRAGYFIRELGVASRPAELPAVRLVRAKDEKKLLQAISELAAQGYRYVSGVEAAAPNQTALMEKGAGDCGDPFEYRSIKHRSPAQLEQTLNTYGRDGFRVVVGSLSSELNLVERPAVATHRYSYRVVEVRDAQTGDAVLNGCDHDGYDPIAWVDAVAWKVHYYIILEKRTPVVP